MRILIVDDEANITNLFQSYLEIHGDHETIIANSGKEALEQVQAQKPDLIILDIAMPDLDGFQVIETLRRNKDTADIPIILSSIMEGPPLAEKKRLGIVDFLRKPIDFGKLSRLVHEIKHAQASGSAESKNARLKVVIIEDDEEDVELLTMGLANMGCEVHSALDGATGLLLVDHIMPDIIVLDYVLPTINGISVMKRIKNSSKTSHIPIVMISAHVPFNQPQKLILLKEPDNSSTLLTIEDLCSKIKKIIPLK